MASQVQGMSFGKAKPLAGMKRPLKTTPAHTAQHAGIVLRASRVKLESSPRLFVALLILLIWLPVPLGSNRPWSWALMEVWICTMGAIWLWRYVKGKAEITESFHRARPVLALLALWLAYGLLQMVPLPYSLVSVLSPNAAETYEIAHLAPRLSGSPVAKDSLLGLSRRPGFNSVVESANASASVSEPEIGSLQRQPRALTLTLDVHASLVSWLKSLAYVLLFGLTLLLVDSPQRLRILAYILVLSGLGQAVYGSLEALLYERGAPANGSFVNRNHFAGYLVICLSIGIGLLIGSIGKRQDSRSWRGRLRHNISLVLSGRGPLRIFLAIMVIGLVLTHSRMGNASFLLSMLIAGVVALVLFKRSPRSVMVLIASLIVIDLVIIGSWIGVDRVVQRIEETTLAQESRDESYAQTWNLIKDYPVTGTGGGSFYGAFLRYREADSGLGFLDHAHNDYLEILAEYGAVGFTILSSAVGLLYFATLSAQRKRRNPLMRGMAFGATMSITAMLIHSTVEFNLQIPAYAATMMVVLAVAWLVLHLPSEFSEAGAAASTDPNNYLLDTRFGAPH